MIAFALLLFSVALAQDPVPEVPAAAVPAAAVEVQPAPEVAPPDPTPAPLPAEIAEVPAPAVVQPPPEPIYEYGPPAPVAPRTVMLDFVGPVPDAPASQPIVVMPQPAATELLGRDFVPWVALRGFFSGSVLLFVTLLLVVLGEILGRLQSQLAARGWIPDAARAAATGARVLAGVFALGVVAAWVPDNLAPAMPWIFVGGALALGWSARDLLPDLVAFGVLMVEGRVRPGQWVRGEGFRGEVLSVGVRATVLLDASGAEVSLPNRQLVGEPYAQEPSAWPRVEVTLVLPPELKPAEARAALREAVLLSPWIAPGPVEVRADTERSGHWSVSARLLEGTYLAAFEGSLGERLAEVLLARSKR